MLIFALAACTTHTPDSADPATDTADTADTGADSAADTAADSGDSGDSGEDTDTYDLDDPVCPEPSGYLGVPPRPARTLSGVGVWTLDFDATAEAAGYTDCGYRREYESLVEPSGHTWQCPECTLLTGGDATVVEGFEDCFSLISSSDATRTEHLGVGPVDGEPHLFRTGGANLALGDMGAVGGTGTADDPYQGGWTDDGTLTEGGTFVLSASLTLTEGESTTWLEDPLVPRSEDYACGWSTCSPGGPSPTALETGALLPNERFTDVCGEEYELWDAWGRYVVLDASSPDCGPCQVMAEYEEAWVEEMAARGITVLWVTLLNASLGDVNLPADADTLTAWTEAFGGSGPVVADEGYGYALFPAYLGDTDGGMSFPTVVVVSPDMEVLGADAGFAPEESGGTGFSAIEDLILADAATR